MSNVRHYIMTRKLDRGKEGLDLKDLLDKEEDEKADKLISISADDITYTIELVDVMLELIFSELTNMLEEGYDEALVFKLGKLIKVAKQIHKEGKQPFYLSQLRPIFDLEVTKQELEFIDENKVFNHRYNRYSQLTETKEEGVYKSKVLNSGVYKERNRYYIHVIMLEGSTLEDRIKIYNKFIGDTKLTSESKYEDMHLSNMERMTQLGIVEEAFMWYKHILQNINWLLNSTSFREKKLEDFDSMELEMKGL